MTIASSFKAMADLAKSAAKKAPQDDALALAQRHAALPVSEGGLGLRPGNTPMDRAAAMGFALDLPLYHGTADDLRKFDLARGGETSGSQVGKIGVSAADNPVIADEFAALAHQRQRRADQNTHTGPNLLPLVHRTERPVSAELPGGNLLDREAAGLILDAWEGGHDAIRLTNYTTPQGKKIGPAYVIKNPNQIRSRFAAFDPFRRGEPDLLAGMGPLVAPTAAMGLAGAAMAPEEAEAGIAGQLAKTADLAALKIAQQAEAKGLPMAKVYDATGWAKGADGKWRWEFDDSGAKWRGGYVASKIRDQGGRGVNDPYLAGYQGTADEMLANENLYAAYPGIGRMPIQELPSNKMTAGTGLHDPAQNTIKVGPVRDDAQAGRSIAAHETQHAIQQREGFARGGSPEEMTTQYARARGLDAMMTDRAKELLGSSTIDMDEKVMRQLAKEGVPLDKWDAEIKRRVDSTLLSDPDYAAMAAELNKLGPNAFIPPEQAYRRLAGEVEARNVQKRMSMTPDERRMLPFWKTEDVPMANQIVKMDSSPYAAMMELKRKANDAARTHQPPRVPGLAESYGRDLMMEILNPINALGLKMSALMYPRELGRPEDLRLVGGEWRTP